MIRSAVTISLVDEARGGPFVFWDNLPAACSIASQLGFDAIEIFAPSGSAVDGRELRGLLDRHNLQLAAVGTGAGMVVHGLGLTDPDPQRRQKAAEFVRKIIDFGAPFRAPAIIGSMQGRWGGALDRDAVLALLADAMNDLGGYAAEQGVPLIYEHLNRYETNLINTVAEGVEFLKSLSTTNVKLLADLFHMNIEERNLAQAIRGAEGFIGHVHYVDSNRRAAGLGHMNHEPIAAALIETGYDGYASAEAFPYSDSESAARHTIESFRRYFRA